MSINFHDSRNRSTYARRIADESWLSMIKENINLSGKEVLDMGCGGGIYTKVLAGSGAAHVTGMDFSKQMVSTAAENCKGMNHVLFLQGDANDSHLPAHKFDLILERALIHHLRELSTCFREANRILKREGTLLIQDRTPQNCLLPGSPNHLRGYFFERYPKLASMEISRRHKADEVREALITAGFTITKETQFWETRRIYNDFESLSEDLMKRTGRSILFELTDSELKELVLFIERKIKNIPMPIVEKDLWTVWFVEKKE